jgi:hypothetical protein
MFDKLFDLPNELESCIFGLIDEITLCRLAGECAQVMKYYNHLLRKEFARYKTKLSRVLREYEDTISYSINEKKSKSIYEYKGYIKKLPRILESVNIPDSHCMHPFIYGKIFKVTYKYNTNCDKKGCNNLCIKTFKSMKVNYDSVMWYNCGRDIFSEITMARYSWSNYNMCVLSKLSCYLLTTGSIIFLFENLYTNKLQKKDTPPHFDEYDKNCTRPQYVGSIGGVMDRLEKLGVPRNMWKYECDKNKGCRKINNRRKIMRRVKEKYHSI